ncbi:hypothetical protein PS005_24840, partial [Shigella sonnei]|nr:hypothetical protein [Shigella sonnei]
TAGVIALTLNSSAYIAEIVRSGVQAVPSGQMEARTNDFCNISRRVQSKGDNTRCKFIKW